MDTDHLKNTLKDIIYLEEEMDKISKDFKKVNKNSPEYILLEAEFKESKKDKEYIANASMSLIENKGTTQEIEK